MKKPRPVNSKRGLKVATESLSLYAMRKAGREAAGKIVSQINPDTPQ